MTHLSYIPVPGGVYKMNKQGPKQSLKIINVPLARAFIIMINV